MLEGHVGDTFRPKLVTRAYFLTMFGAIVIFEPICETKYDRETRSGVKVCGKGGASGGGGGKPPELLHTACLRV